MDLFTLGNDTTSTATETSAIFAGTGADVRRKGQRARERKARDVSHSAPSPGERKQRRPSKQNVVRKELGRGAGDRDTEKAWELDTSALKPKAMLPPHATTGSITRADDGESRETTNTGGREVEYVPPSASQDSDMVHGSASTVISGETQLGHGSDEPGQGRAQVKDERTGSTMKVKGMKSLEEIRKMWQLLATSGTEGSGCTTETAKGKVEKKAEGAVQKSRERRKRGVG